MSRRVGQSGDGVTAGDTNDKSLAGAGTDQSYFNQERQMSEVKFNTEYG